MFITKENRYITQGINQKIPYQIQFACWQSIEHDLSLSLEVDYLQFFEFNTIGSRIIEIIHRQEEPERVKRTILEIADTEIVLMDKIWAVDGGIAQLM